MKLGRLACVAGLAAIVTAAAVAISNPSLAQSGDRAESAAAPPFVGVFALAEYGPHGDQPTGRISYDEAGRMSALIFPPGRSPLPPESSAEDFRAMMRGVVAYYGTYEVDEATGRVIHHVEAASNPAWIGDEFVRWYRFEGSDLRLSLNAEFQNTLLWARLPEQ